MRLVTSEGGMEGGGSMPVSPTVVICSVCATFIITRCSTVVTLLEKPYYLTFYQQDIDEVVFVGRLV